MAKTRRSVKKKSAKAAKKSAPRRKPAKKPAKPRRPVARPQKIELKKLRQEFGYVLAALSAKTSASPDVEAKLDDTRRRISQWMTDVDDICTPELQEICGPDMAFPIPNP